MLKPLNYLLLLCYLLGCFVPGVVLAKENATTNDIAVLIDVSGSMKQNDPNNLRMPALKLFINLLPEGTRAGVWLFAEDSSVLVTAGKVDEKWKQQALDAVAKIHSRGQLTNIETALKTATDAWQKAPPGTARNVVLLTDGVVDIGKDPAKNTASKARILAELLPKITQTGAHIQTIALSKQADSELLKKLAFSTKGWSETVESALQLERIFLKMFKQAVPQDSVPLVGNKFKIDQSIKEFSVLVFKKPGSTTELVSPQQQKINKSTLSEQVHWMSEPHYDLVTIKNPADGDWQIVGEMDPDNQVMVLTDLKLELKNVPLYKTGVEPLVFEASFSNQKQLITREDFLKLIKITLQKIDSNNKTSDYALSPVSDRLGYFRYVFNEPLSTGQYRFKVAADGKTFNREINLNVAVIDSPVQLSTAVDNAKRQVTLTLTPDSKVLDLVSLEIDATLNQLMRNPKKLSPVKQDEVWLLTLEAPAAGEQQIINFVIKAKTRDGKAIEPDVQPYLLDEQVFKASDEPADAVGKKATKEKAADPLKESKNDPQKAESEPSKMPDWLITTLITVAINLVIIALGIMGFRKLKQRAATKQAHLLDRLA